MLWKPSLKLSRVSGQPLRQEVEDAEKAYSDSVKTLEESKNAQIAEAESAKALKDELFALEGQLKNGNLTEEEATKVREKFNAAASSLESIIPGITSSIYDETGAINVQQGAIENLCTAYYDLAMAKAEATAYEEELIALNKKKIQLEMSRDDAKELYDEKEKEVQDLEDDGLAAGYEKAEARELAKTYVDIDKKVQSTKKEIDELTSKMLDAKAKASELSEQNKELFEETEKGTVTTTAAIKKQTEETSKEFETQYKNLKRSLEREEITYADYYNDLKKLRDTYFKEGSDEWEKYTEELEDFTEDTFDNCLDVLDDFKNESIDKINELKDEQESLKEKLITDKAPIEWGTIDGESFISLANYDKEINQMQQYGNMLDELFKKRGDLPQSVIDEIKEMDTEQAMRYMSALLNSSDPQFNAFVQARQKLEEVASENSTKLMSAEAEEMKRILEEKFGELPEDFFNLGDESATAFGEAFLSELEVAMQTVRATIMAEMSEISNAAVLSFQAATSGGASSVVNNNNYSSSYIFNSSKETTTQQRAAARNAEALERMRGEC